MKKAILLTLCALIMISGCSKPQPDDKPGEETPPPVVVTVTPGKPPKDGPAAADYLSFEKDVHMVYEGTGIEFASFETWVDYVSKDAVQLRVDNGGTVSSIVYTARDDALVMTLSRGEQYGRANMIGQSTTEDILIREPIAVGTAWQSGGYARSITAVDMEVTVPYGTFKALEVTSENDFSVSKDYFAKGIGLIKTEFRPKDEDVVITSELKARETGAPVTLHLNVYYPREDFSGIVFTWREASLMTNEPLAPVLTELFKAPPGGARAVIEGDAQILTVGFDAEAETAAVDVSAKFAESMKGLPASSERLILQCIANTVADAFQTEKVTLTLEGGEYTSDNFRFDIKQNQYVRIDTAQPAED
jgi:hypothetical protein